MKKKNILSKNYLENIPERMSGIEWSTDDNGLVVLHIENKGAFNKIAQKQESKTH